MQTCICIPFLSVIKYYKVSFAIAQWTFANNLHIERVYFRHVSLHIKSEWKNCEIAEKNSLNRSKMFLWITHNVLETHNDYRHIVISFKLTSSIVSRVFRPKSIHVCLFYVYLPLFAHHWLPSTRNKTFDPCPFKRLSYIQSI